MGEARCYRVEPDSCRVNRGEDGSCRGATGLTG